MKKVAHSIPMGYLWCFSEEIKDLPADSVVGLGCVELIQQATMLTQNLADVPMDFKANIMITVNYQCRVFLNG